MSTTEKALIAYLIFIVVGFLLYFIFPKKHKWLVLLILSVACSFYLTSYWMIFVLINIVVAYAYSLYIYKSNKKYELNKDNLTKDEKKLFKKKIKKEKLIILYSLLLIVVIVLALLKYFHLPIGRLNSFFNNYHFIGIAFPILGISYYTLMTISYMVDIYRGKYNPETNPLKIATYIAFFPLQIEGPIERYDNLNSQLFKEENPHFEDIEDGVAYIAFGLFKKIVIADRLNIFVSAVFSDSMKNYNSITILAGMIFYAIQLYCDFSGFIDIAVGASRIFGIKLTKNFDSPFKSKSVEEFWRRWHISLGSWFKDYIFYPIALSKPVISISKKIHGCVPEVLEKVFVNAIPLFVVWIACGIWHGAGWKFVVYGMYYYVLIMIGMILAPLGNKIFKKDNIFKSVLLAIKTFALVVIGLTLFRSDNLEQFGQIIKYLFKNITLGRDFGLMPYHDWIISLVSIAVLSLYGIIIVLKDKLPIQKVFNVTRIAIVALLLFATVAYGAYGENYSAVDPMYAIY